MQLSQTITKEETKKKKNLAKEIHSYMFLDPMFDDPNLFLISYLIREKPVVIIPSFFGSGDGKYENQRTPCTSRVYRGDK